jgi:hypothetical protein
LPPSRCRRIYTEDVDALYARAVKAGAQGVAPPADMFWGDRFARVVDPFGHSWAMATHTEDVSPEELSRQMDDWGQAPFFTKWWTGDTRRGPNLEKLPDSHDLVG